MADIIDKTSKGDIRSEHLGDVAPSSLQKLYVYKVLQDDLRIPLYIPNGTSLIQVSNETSSFQNLKSDAQGFYVEGIASKDFVARVESAPDTKTVDSRLKYEPQITLYTNDIFVGNDEERFFFTIGKPYDFNSYAQGTQLVWQLQGTRDVDVINEGVEDEIVTTHALRDGRIRTLTLRNYDLTIKSEGVFTKSFLVDVATQTQYFKEISDTKPLELVFNKETKVNQILGKTNLIDRYGQGGDNIQPINFITTGDQKYIPIKVKPEQLEDKVEYFHDWADKDSILYWNDAIKFVSEDGKTLASAGMTLITQAEQNLIEDAILFTYSSINQYSEIPRNEQGNFEVGTSIGHSKTPLQALLDSNDIQLAINKLVENYLFAHPTSRDDGTYSKISAILAALSRYVRWQGAIARGNNPINEVYLPWYLDITSPILVTTSQDSKTIILDESPKFKLKSRWFDVQDKDNGSRTKGIYTKDNIDLSNPRLIQTDRKIILDKLPQQFSSSDLKTAINPGDINPSTTSDLNYIMYIPEGKVSIEEALGHITKKITYPKGISQDIAVPYLPSGVMPTYAFNDEFKDNLLDTIDQPLDASKFNIAFMSSFILSQNFYKSLISFPNQIFDNTFKISILGSSVSSQGVRIVSPVTAKKIEENSVWITNDYSVMNNLAKRAIFRTSLNNGNPVDPENVINYHGFQVWNTYSGTASQLVSNNAHKQYSQSTKQIRDNTLVTSEKKLKDYYKIYIAQHFNIPLHFVNDTNAPHFFDIEFPDLNDANNWERTLVRTSSIALGDTYDDNKNQRMDLAFQHFQFGRMSWVDIREPSTFNVDKGIIRGTSQFPQLQIANRFSKSEFLTNRIIDSGSKIFSDFKNGISTIQSLKFNQFNSQKYKDGFVDYAFKSLGVPYFFAQNLDLSFFQLSIDAVEKYTMKEIATTAANGTYEYFAWRPKNVKFKFLNQDVVIGENPENKVLFDKNTWGKHLIDASSLNEFTLEIKESEEDINSGAINNLIKLTTLTNTGAYVQFKSSSIGVVSGHKFELNSNEDETINETSFLFV